jgi:hypothetical protein
MVATQFDSKLLGKLAKSRFGVIFSRFEPPAVQNVLARVLTHLGGSFGQPDPVFAIVVGHDDGDGGSASTVQLRGHVVEPVQTLNNPGPQHQCIVTAAIAAGAAGHIWHLSSNSGRTP